MGVSALLVTAALGHAVAHPQIAPPPPPPQEQGPRPKVEVVFVLDTTGSMSGLISGAQAKIWSIASHIARGQPTPDLRVGLVAYRDIGDAYVTKDYGLTADLDTVYSHLMSFRADGGGDGPEHVNKGLYDAVHKMQWSENAMKMVFLVGDAPPHMDYNDGFEYHAIVKEARKKEIVIHAIRCGNDPETGRYWKEIASTGRGSFASIQESGGVVAVATPMDGEMAELSGRLSDTTIVYGGEGARARVAAKASVAAGAPAPAAADRGAYYATSGASLDEDDVLEKAAKGEVNVAKLEPAKLPENMRKMNVEERRAYVKVKKDEREALKKKLVNLAARRDEYLRKEAAKAPRPAEPAFDKVVNTAVSEQAKDYGISYPTP